jgi:hypothetical protein
VCWYLVCTRAYVVSIHLTHHADSAVKRARTSLDELMKVDEARYMDATEAVPYEMAHAHAYLNLV